MTRRRCHLSYRPLLESIEPRLLPGQTSELALLSCLSLLAEPDGFGSELRSDRVLAPRVADCTLSFTAPFPAYAAGIPTVNPSPADATRPVTAPARVDLGAGLSGSGATDLMLARTFPLADLPSGESSPPVTAVLGCLGVSEHPGSIRFNLRTDTIRADGQSLIGTSSTYEARVRFTTSFPFRTIFNEWTDGLEDKQLRAHPQSFLGYNNPVHPSFTEIRANVPIALCSWHHLAYVYDGAQERLYLDGQRVAFRAASGLVGNGPGQAFIGAIFRDTMRTSFIGDLDTLRISNVARYTSASFRPPSGDLRADPNTLLLYNFNAADYYTDGDILRVRDLSPSGRDGSLGIGFAGATSPEP